MRIIFIGSSKSSGHLLKHCFKLKFNIVGIVTKKKSWNNDFLDLSKIYRNSQIPFIYWDKNINKINTWAKKLKPDLFFCFGWSDIIKKKLLKIPKISTVGFHPTLLPLNRGRHPIIWSIFLGLKKTGSTFFEIKNEKIDSGPIISQKQIFLTKNDNATSLYKKILDVSKKQLPDIVRYFENKKKKRIQKNSKKISFWRKRDVNDEIIDWRMSSETIYRLIQSLQKPYNFSSFKFRNKIYRVEKAKVLKKDNNKSLVNFEPGKILKVGKTFFDVKCGIGSIRILKLKNKINLNKTFYL